MLVKILLGVSIGAAIGGLLGSSRSCESGACALTASPWRGSIFGGLMGLFVVLASVGPTAHSVGDAAPGAPNEELHVADVAEPEFADKIGEGVVLVDFWAPWCGPCRQQAPILESVERRVKDRATVVKVNIDEDAKLARSLKVAAIPTLMIFSEGELVRRFEGVQSEKTLVSAIENAIPDERAVASTTPEHAGL